MPAYHKLKFGRRLNVLDEDAPWALIEDHYESSPNSTPYWLNAGDEPGFRDIWFGEDESEVLILELVGRAFEVEALVLAEVLERKEVLTYEEIQGYKRAMIRHTRTGSPIQNENPSEYVEFTLRAACDNIASRVGRAMALIS